MNGYPLQRRRSISIIVAFFIFFATRVTAQPAKGYDVISYNATVRLDPEADSIFGHVTMQARVLGDTASIASVLQFARYLTIDSVLVNGSRAAFASDDTASGEYHVVANLGRGMPFTVQTYYHGKGEPEQNSWKWGGVSDEDSLMFAMGVGFANSYTGCTRHWLPCYDLPDDKADSVDLTFITPANDLTASNGLLVSNLLTPGGERIMHWHESRPIATYLLTFATGPLTEQDIPNTLGIPFQVYALASDSIAASNEMRVRVAPILAFYDSLFAPYPFEKVGYVVTPIGSMEHQTMISLDSHVLIGDSASMALDTTAYGTTAIHELSHQWWGDRVTCKTFDDAWLNEGFAQYCESLVLERLFGREKYISRQRQNIASAKGYAYYPLFGAPTFDNHNTNYPTAIYTKGAAALGMLRQYLGDSIFFAAIRYYGNIHAYGTATSYDLWNDFDTVSGQDLGWFFKPWVFGTGYPKDTIVWSKTAGGASITFHQMKNNATTPYFRMAIPVRGATMGGESKTVTVWMDSMATSSYDANFGFTPDTLQFDPEGLLVMRIVRVIQSSSGIVRENFPEGAFTLKAFPNPNRHDVLSVMVTGAQVSGTLSVFLIDANGATVRRLDTVMTASTNVRLSLSGLARGSYILEARSGARRATKNITVE